MIEIEKVDVWGFQHSIRGARNSYDSWDKSDSEFYDDGVWGLGKNDLQLFKNLCNASKTGNYAHRKPLRQVFVSMDVTAPLYWWKEFDQYKVGTVTSSCSTMHTIHKKEFELNDFSHEHLIADFKPIEHKQYMPEDFLTLNTQNVFIRSDTVLMVIIEALNFYRHRYLETKDKKYWWQLIQLLPTSYNQKRTVTMNYENVVNIIEQRSGHKLDEWNALIKELECLPYVREIMDGDMEDGGL